MTQEEKQLLIKDLCARLPYGIMLHQTYSNGYGKDYCLSDFTSDELSLNEYVLKYADGIKPYLRPMSSMTDEELKEFTGFASISQHRFFIGDSYFWYNTYEEEDWLNEHHFDYRRLIEKGLALAAPEDMYKTE